MPPKQLYVTTHTHTDGPIPGPHSLLTLASAAYSADGALISTFSANIRELPGATLHPAALQSWRSRAEDWLSTRRATRPPAVVMNAYAGWVDRLGSAPVFVADPDEPDHLFCYWYLQRFTGSWPFAATVPASSLDARFRTVGLCTLSGCHDDTLAMVAS